MPSLPNAQILSLDFLRQLKNSLVGDQFAKLQLFTSERLLIDQLIDTEFIETEAQSESLDVLLSLVNLEEDVRNELNEAYATVVAKILAKAGAITAADDLLIAYKTVRLANLCINNCNINYKKSGILLNSVAPTQLQDILIHHIENRNGQTSTYHSATIVEIMSYLSKQRSRITRDLKGPLESLLLSIRNRYSGQLEFKYLLKISNNQNITYDPLSNKGIEDNLAMQYAAVPDPVNISNPYDQSMLSLGIVLYREITDRTYDASFLIPGQETISKNGELWRDGNFTLFISSFLKSNNVDLKCCALIFFLYPYISQKTLSLPQQPLKQWLPYLVESFNYDDIPWWFDPFDALTAVIDLHNETTPINNPVTEYLFRTNVLHGLVTLFAKCLCLKYHNRGSNKTVAKFIKLFGSITSYDEKCRALLLEDKALLQHLECGLETHLELLNSFLRYIPDIRSSMENEDLSPLHTSDVTLSWLFLLKSFSRSVTALRTSLKRNKLANVLLELLKTICKVLELADFAGHDFLKAEIDILGAALGIISNFVVEFSNLQSLIVDNGIVDKIGDILNDPIFNSKLPWETERRRGIFSKISGDLVKTNALWVLRHLMYNSHNEEKLELLSTIPMETILQFINDYSWPVQEQCFQLLRNLTCNSRKVVNILLENFKDVEYFDSRQGERTMVGSTYLFEFLAHKIRMLEIKDNHQRKTLEGILYIIVNITAINENKRQLVIEQDELLSIIQEILSESGESNPKYGNNNDLKVACLWILTNLIWNSSFSNYAHSAPEDYFPPGEASPVSDRDKLNEDEASKTNHGEEKEESDEDMHDDDDDDTGAEFVRPSLGQPNAIAGTGALERCRKLVKMGLYDLIKKKTFDEYLPVREKARTLLFHMDLLSKGL